MIVGIETRRVDSQSRSPCLWYVNWIFYYIDSPCACVPSSIIIFKSFEEAANRGWKNSLHTWNRKAKKTGNDHLGYRLLCDIFGSIKSSSARMWIFCRVKIDDNTLTKFDFRDKGTYRKFAEYIYLVIDGSHGTRLVVIYYYWARFRIQFNWRFLYLPKQNEKLRLFGSLSIDRGHHHVEFHCVIPRNLPTIQVRKLFSVPRLRVFLLLYSHYYLYSNLGSHLCGAHNLLVIMILIFVLDEWYANQYLMWRSAWLTGSGATYSRQYPNSFHSWIEPNNYIRACMIVFTWEYGTRFLTCWGVSSR